MLCNVLPEYIELCLNKICLGSKLGHLIEHLCCFENFAPSVFVAMLLARAIVFSNNCLPALMRAIVFSNIETRNCQGNSNSSHSTAVLTGVIQSWCVDLIHLLERA